MQRTDTPQLTTDAPQITTIPVLRGVDIPDGTLRIVQPEPRVIPTAPSDRIDGHHFEQAFGGAA